MCDKEMAACILLKPRSKCVLKKQPNQILTSGALSSLLWGALRGLWGSWRDGAGGQSPRSLSKQLSATALATTTISKAVTFHPAFNSCWCFPPPVAAPKQAHGARPTAKAAQHLGAALVQMWQHPAVMSRGQILKS